MLHYILTSIFVLKNQEVIFFFRFYLARKAVGAMGFKAIYTEVKVYIKCIVKIYKTHLKLGNNLKGKSKEL